MAVTRRGVVLAVALVAAAGVAILNRSAVAADYRGSSAARGTILKRINYESGGPTGVDPKQAFWQCSDTTSSSGATRGTLSADGTTSNSGRYSGLIVVPPTQPTASFGRSACEVVTSQTVKSGADVYYSLALQLPLSWSGHAAWSQRAMVAFFGYVAMQGPIDIEVYDNRIALALAAGDCVAGVGCAYDNSCGGECWGHSNNVLCRPRNAPNRYGGVRGCKIVPPGRLRLGIWQQMIVHVRETPRADGLVEAWWRPKGRRRWQKTVTMSGIPTLELGTNAFGQTLTAATYDAGTLVATDKFGLQEASAQPVEIRQDDDCIATSFAAATSCFG
jgi:hypothetical protein